MARKELPKIKEKDLHGFKHFKLLMPILENLHDTACARDTAGNRKLHYDQYAALILLYFFNAIVSSLRGIQQASELAKVQRILGCPRASLGSLSEAARVFDADLLRGIIGRLLERLQPIEKNTAFDQIKHVITLVDGTYLRALSTIVEAMWREDGNKAFKLHTHFELLKGVPVRMDLTDGKTGETAVLKACLQPDRLYVMDRGYTDFAMFHQIIGIGSSFVCRVPDRTVFEVIEEHPLSAEAREAKVVRDMVLRFTGVPATKIGLDRPMRIVEVKCKPHRKPSGKNGRGGPELLRCIPPARSRCIPFGTEAQPEYGSRSVPALPLCHRERNDGAVVSGRLAGTGTLPRRQVFSGMALVSNGVIVEDVSARIGPRPIV